MKNNTTNSKHLKRAVFTILLLFTFFIFSFSQSPKSALEFTVSMEQPNSHYYHITLHCEGFKAETLDFKMPVWTPGYYWIQNFPKNVVNFQAQDSNGKPLTWKKTTKNTWQVLSNNAEIITLTYDVYAFTRSVADPFLDAGRGYISTSGLCMHPAEHLGHPATITFKPYQNWKISTGLEPVKGKENTFFAADFDELYDCPIYIGNQKIFSFEAKGLPHYVAIENPDAFNGDKFIADLKKMVEAGSDIIGDIPYKHYTFIIMGPGGGGLEHRNSTAVFSSNTNYNQQNPASYQRWLCFLAHEYFHLYNIKAIRPIALGPFDYDQENYTNMLWVSEGITAYYQFLIVNRANMMNREETLQELQKRIKAYENIPGHLFQSATQSSMDTWVQFFNRSENASNTTISYYDKGCALGILLDLKIRHETKNQRSLDDVMRTLYQAFYKEKKRGFTDEEFQTVCEKTAGVSLAEVFEYASTVKEIDYPKYLAYAGLNIDTTSQPLPGAYLGAVTPSRGDNLTISSIEWNSPAWHAGLSAQDEIIEIDHIKANPQILKDVLNNKNSGDIIKLLVSYRNEQREVSVKLGQKTEKSFHITPMANPNSLQMSILNAWIKN
ncbi:MAG: M61 family metallopeptidase [Saprospiraceae bacterium]|nr:M61 family metallopeptidase [Saprospiraceae bacterium]